MRRPVASPILLRLALGMASLCLVAAGRYHHTVPMGSANSLCDDAKSRLSIDWNSADTKPYTCPLPTKSFPVPESANGKFSCRFSQEVIASHAETGILERNLTLNGFHHVCTNETIKYKSPYPASGNHRPAWPYYGEYTYLPPQRWLHNLEHGSVVALYHPCVPDKIVEEFKNAVICIAKETTKLRKLKLTQIVLSPEAQIPTCQPFVLLAWQNRLLLSKVKKGPIRDFFKKYYLTGPEDNHADGQYKLGLIQHSKDAECVSDNAVGARGSRASSDLSDLDEVVGW